MVSPLSHGALYICDLRMRSEQLLQGSDCFKYILSLIWYVFVHIGAK